MNTLSGYSKKTLTDTSLLLAQGGDKALSDFIGTLNWDSTNRKLQYKKVGDAAYTDLVTFGSNATNSTAYLPISGGIMNGPISSYYTGTWLNGMKSYINGTTYQGSLVDYTSTGYYSLVHWKSKTGGLTISSHSSAGDTITFGYMSQETIDADSNSLTKAMIWDGPTNTLTATTFAGNATTATTAAKSRQLLYGSVTASDYVDSTGTAITSGTKYHKTMVVTISGATLATGNLYMLRMPTTGTPCSGATININNGTSNLGAKTIKYANSSNGTYFTAGAWYLFTYDGTNLVAIHSYNSNTTYTAMIEGYCSTAADTAAKVVTCTNFGNLTTGTVLKVRFTVTNTKVGALTLNVNSTGAKTIAINGTISSTTNYTLPAGTYFCYYDGTYWDVRTDGNARFKNVIGDLTGNASTATNVAWSGVTGKPISASDSNTILSPYNKDTTGYYKFLTIVTDNGNSGLIDFIISSSDITGELGRAEYFHFASRPSSNARLCYYTRLGRTDLAAFGSKIYIVDGTTTISDVSYKTYTFYLYLDAANSLKDFCNIKLISTMRLKSITWSNTWQTADPGADKWQPSFGGKVAYANVAGSADAVEWTAVSNKPATATRWPSWSEITGTVPTWNQNTTGYAKSLYVASDSTTSNILPAGNRFSVTEINGSASGITGTLPTTAWYYLYSAQGGDVKYNTLLALGMTALGMWYRNYNNAVWSAWKQVVFSDDSRLTNARQANGGNADTVDNFHAYGQEGAYIIKQGMVLPTNNDTRTWFRVATLPAGVTSNNRSVLLYIDLPQNNKYALVRIRHRGISSTDFTFGCEILQGNFSDIRLYHTTYDKQIEIFVQNTQTTTSNRSINTRVLAEYLRGLSYKDYIKLDNLSGANCIDPSAFTNVETSANESGYVKAIYVGTVNYAGSAGSATTATNLTNKPSLSFTAATSSSAESTLTVTAGEKTSDSVTISKVRSAFAADSASASSKLSVTTPLSGNGVYFYSGLPTVETTYTTTGRAYPGSISDYRLYSFPVATNGVADNTQTVYDNKNVIANIMNLRLQWGTTYYHDIFLSPNNNKLWHRHINNETAGDWYHIVQAAKGGKGGASTPVYVDANGEIQAGTALGTASTHAHGDYLTAVGYDTTNKKITWSKGGTAQTAFTVEYATASAYANYVNVISSNEIKFNSNGSTYWDEATDKNILHINNTWADSAPGYISEYDFKDGHGSLTNVKASKFIGALQGNADTATKTSYLSGWSSTVNATNNYPYHRILHAEGTGSWNDKTITLYISQGYTGGRFGIIRITSRSDDLNSTTSGYRYYYAEAKWLVRSGFGLSDIKIGVNNKKGAWNADVYYVSNGVYASIYMTVIDEGSKGSASSAWTRIISSETSTDNGASANPRYTTNTHTECYSATSLFTTYNVALADSTDGASISYAASAGSVAWANVSDKPASATRWPSWSEVTGKPTFATVATSGKYSDLSGLPTIPTTLPANGGNADTIDSKHVMTVGSNSQTGLMHAFARGKYTSANLYFGNGIVVTIDPKGTGCLSANDTILSLGDKNTHNTLLLCSYNADGIYYRRITDNLSYGDWKRVAFSGESLPASDVYAWAKTNSSALNPATATASLTTILRRSVLVGSKTSTYDSSTSSATTSSASYAFADYVAADLSISGNMNQVAYRGNCVGMISLSNPASADTDAKKKAINPNGATGWHHFINLSYNTETSNMWLTLFAVAAGTTDVYVRSRKGGSITDGTAWTAPWVRLVKTTDLGSYLPLSGGSLTGTLRQFRTIDSSNNYTAYWELTNGIMLFRNTKRVTSPDTFSSYEDISIGTTSDDVYSNGGLYFDASEKRWGIGTTSPSLRLHIEGGHVRISSSNTGSGGDVYLELWRGTNASWLILNNSGILKILSNYSSSKQVSYGAAGCASITFSYNTGNITTNGQFYANSDIRYKNVLEHINPSIYDLATLPIFKYSWKEQAETEHLGTSAQAVEELLPQLVTLNEIGFKSLDYATLAAIIGVQACREIIKLKQEIEELKTKLKGGH